MTGSPFDQEAARARPAGAPAGGCPFASLFLDSDTMELPESHPPIPALRQGPAASEHQKVLAPLHAMLSDTGLLPLPSGSSSSDTANNTNNLASDAAHAMVRSISQPTFSRSAEDASGPTGSLAPHRTSAFATHQQQQHRQEALLLGLREVQEDAAQSASTSSEASQEACTTTTSSSSSVSRPAAGLPTELLPHAPAAASKGGLAATTENSPAAPGAWKSSRVSDHGAADATNITNTSHSVPSGQQQPPTHPQHHYYMHNSHVHHRPADAAVAAASHTHAASGPRYWELAVRPKITGMERLNRRQLRQLGRPFPLSEVRQHCFKDDCWIAVGGRVYDITEHLVHHPGWDDAHAAHATTVLSILAHAGSECTQEFTDIHRYIPEAWRQLRAYYIGDLAEE